MLGEQLGLSEFKQQVLFLCVAPEIDPSLSALYTATQGDPDYLFPTFALALALLDNPTWDALATDGPLRYWQLITIDHSRHRPVTVSPLQADERIVSYLNGLIGLTRACALIYSRCAVRHSRSRYRLPSNVRWSRRWPACGRTSRRSDGPSCNWWEATC